jgi:hypothetical protein
MEAAAISPQKRADSVDVLETESSAQSAPARLSRGCPVVRDVRSGSCPVMSGSMSGCVRYAVACPVQLYSGIKKPLALH